MAGLLRGDLLKEMSFWISATVDDIYIPLAAENPCTNLAHIYSELSLSFWAACLRVQRAVRGQRMNEAAGWTKSLLTCCQSHFWHLQLTWRSRLIPPCWAEWEDMVKGDQRAIDRVCCFWGSVEHRLLLLQHWRWGRKTLECYPDSHKLHSWCSSWELGLLYFSLFVIFGKKMSESELFPVQPPANATQFKRIEFGFSVLRFNIYQQKNDQW